MSTVMAIEVVRTNNRWCIYERTHMGFLPLTCFHRRKTAATVAKFYGDLMARTLKAEVDLTIENRHGDIAKRITCRWLT